MTLEILPLLPAPESAILASFPGVYPDTILAEIARLARRGAVLRHEGRVVPAPKPKDSSWPCKAPARVNPINPNQLGRRVCRQCGTEYLGIKKHFGDVKTKVCNDCREGRPHGFHGNAKGKVCARCGEYRYPLTRMFRQSKRGGVAYWSDVCNLCRGTP